MTQTCRIEILTLTSQLQGEGRRIGQILAKASGKTWATTGLVETGEVVEATYRTSELESIDYLRPERHDADSAAAAAQTLKETLSTKGFTFAPDSEGLISALNKVPEQQFQELREGPRLAEVLSWEFTEACVRQLKMVLPSEHTILGFYKARSHVAEQSAVTLHKDDVKLNEDSICLALFPPLATDTPSHAEFFQRYNAWCHEMKRLYPGLSLPSSEQLNVHCDLAELTGKIIDAIRSYNETVPSEEDALFFNNVNMWIPRDVKQLVFLPLSYSSDFHFPLDGKDAQRLKSVLHNLEAFGQRRALIFFGQAVFHQALIGPRSELGEGSFIARYLTLAPRRVSLIGALRYSIAGLAVGANQAQPAKPTAQNHDRQADISEQTLESNKIVRDFMGRCRQISTELPKIAGKEMYAYNAADPLSAPPLQHLKGPLPMEGDHLTRLDAAGCIGMLTSQSSSVIGEAVAILPSIMKDLKYVHKSGHRCKALLKTHGYDAQLKTQWELPLCMLSVCIALRNACSDEVS